MNTILLIEDNPDHVELTLRAAHKANIPAEIVVTGSGPEALDYLAKQKAQELPRFILLDLCLPGMSGLDVLKHIRADKPTHYLPVVILTTSNEKSDELQGYDLGANSYICKPVDFKRFSHVIQQLGEYWLEINESPAV